MRQRSRAFVLGAALAAFTAWCAIGGIARAQHEPGMHHGTLPPTHAPADMPTASVYQLDSSWTGTDGAPAPLSGLWGQPQVVAMFYASCTSVCPLIVDEMLKIERELPTGAQGRTGFALFSFDPERDTPPVLKSYAMKRSLLRPNWRLFTGTPDAVQDLAAALGMRIRKEPNGDFSHSTLITLLDAEGIIRAQLTGLNRDRHLFLAAVAKAAGR